MEFSGSTTLAKTRANARHFICYTPEFISSRGDHFHISRCQLSARLYLFQTEKSIAIVQKYAMRSTAFDFYERTFAERMCPCECSFACERYLIDCAAGDFVREKRSSLHAATHGDYSTPPTSISRVKLSRRQNAPKKHAETAFQSRDILTPANVESSCEFKRIATSILPRRFIPSRYINKRRKVRRCSATSQ